MWRYNCLTSAVIQKHTLITVDVLSSDISRHFPSLSRRITTSVVHSHVNYKDILPTLNPFYMMTTIHFSSPFPSMEHYYPWFISSSLRAVAVWPNVKKLVMVMEKIKQIHVTDHPIQYTSTDDCLILFCNYSVRVQNLIVKWMIFAPVFKTVLSCLTQK